MREEELLRAAGGQDQEEDRGHDLISLGFRSAAEVDGGGEREGGGKEEPDAFGLEVEQAGEAGDDDGQERGEDQRTRELFRVRIPRVDGGEGEDRQRDDAEGVREEDIGAGLDDGILEIIVRNCAKAAGPKQIRIKSKPS